MKTFIIGCRNLSQEAHFRIQNELSLSFGKKSFVEIFDSIWLLRCDAGAIDVHQSVEYILTEKVDFFIYEIADTPGYVQNVESWVSNWTDVNF